MTQAFAAQHDGRPGGRVVLMTSGQCIGPMPGEVACAAAKAAPADIDFTLADQFADAGITVDPGSVAWCRPLCSSWNIQATRRNRCVIIRRTAVTGAGVIGSVPTRGPVDTGTHEVAVLPARLCSA